MVTSFLAWIFSLTAVIAALFMIIQRHMIYSIGLMIVVLLSIAGLFLTLNAPFLALVQIIVYAGAVMVLFAFASMIVGDRKSMTVNFDDFHSWIILLIGILFIGAMFQFLINYPIPSQLAGEFAIELEGGIITFVGKKLFSKYYLVLQSIGMIILVALVGSIYLAQTPAEEN